MAAHWTDTEGQHTLSDPEEKRAGGGGGTYMQGRDALVVGVSGIVLAGLKQLLHGGQVAYPGELHDVILGGIAGQVAELHLMVELGGGRV